MTVSISTKSASTGHTPIPSFGSSIIHLRNLSFSTTFNHLALYETENHLHTSYFHFSAAWYDILDYILSENAAVIFQLNLILC